MPTKAVNHTSSPTCHPPIHPLTHPPQPPSAIGQALRQQQSTSSIQQSTAYAATTKRMNLLPVCATHSCHLPHYTSLSPLPTPTPRPCNACRRLSMHHNLRAAAATPTANSNCWATRDILHTDSDTVCSLLPLPIHPLAPSPTPAVFYLSVGSRHSQLPFRIELNSNFYQFTKATTGKSKERQPGCQCGLGSGAELWEHARG